MAYPNQDTVLGREPRIYRSTDKRIVAARQAHDDRRQEKWKARAVELAESRAPASLVDAERRAHEARAGEAWAEREAVIRRAGNATRWPASISRSARRNRSACCGPPPTLLAA